MLKINKGFNRRTREPGGATTVWHGDSPFYPGKSEFEKSTVGTLETASGNAPTVTHYGSTRRAYRVQAL